MLIIVSISIASMLSVGAAQSSTSMSINDCKQNEQDDLEWSISMMMERFGWETGQVCDTVMTTETGDGKIHVTGDVSPGETVMITLIDGLADADVTVNGEPVAPTDVNGEIEVMVPDDGELTIIVEAEQSDHEIILTGSETDTSVSSSVSSSSSSSSSTTVSTTTSTSTSTSSNSTSNK